MTNRLQLELLEDRCVPSAPTYHGGPIIQNPAVATLFVGAYNQNFDQAVSVATGPYTQILGVFGVHEATRNGTVTIPSQGTLTNAQVGQLLDQEIAAGVLPQPLSPNQMYMVFLNQSSVADVPNAGAFHTWTYYNGTPIVYTVGFLAGANAGTYGVFHEYAEATTDPFTTGWYGDNYNQEVADLGLGNTFPMAGFQVATLMGPNGQFITGPTTTTSPVTQPNPPPPPTITSTISLGGFGDLFSSWEQEIVSWLNSIWQLEQQWINAELSWLESRTTGSWWGL